MRSPACVVLVLACAACAQARLRGPQTELLAVLGSDPRFSELSAAVKGGSPAEHVLEVLGGMEAKIADVQAADHIEFEKLRDRCAAEAGKFRAAVLTHEAEAAELRAGIDAASRTIEGSHLEITSLVGRINDEQAALDRLGAEVRDLEAQHAAAVRRFELAEDSFVEIVHALQAIEANLAAAAELGAPQRMDQQVLLQLDATLQRASLGAHATALRDALNSQSLAGDVSVQIVDLSLALRRSVESQRAQNRVQHQNADTAFKAQMERVEARRAAHERARDAGIKEKAHVERERDAAVARRAGLNDRLNLVTKQAGGVHQDATAAEEVCIGYAKEFETRRRNREEDMQAIRAVRDLIEEKQREIARKLEELRHLASSAEEQAAAEEGHEQSLHELADKLGVQPPPPLRIAPPEYNEVDELRKALEAQSSLEETMAEAQSQLDALIAPPEEEFAAAAAATASTGLAFGGDL